jgi:hypothetical protein
LTCGYQTSKARKEKIGINKHIFNNDETKNVTAGGKYETW